MNTNELLQKIDQAKAKIDTRRPLNAIEAKQLDNYFRVDLTYSSNALEGNTLTLSETKVLLEDGITAGGKPLRDCYEVSGHAEAYDFMLTAARAAPFQLTEAIVCKLHELFYARLDSAAAGQYRDHQVFITGTDYLPPTPEDTPAQMAEFITEFQAKAQKLHPVLLAAWAHRRFVDIHPFTDGNGRTARLLMNLILVNRGYFVVSIPPIYRQEYISALRLAQRGEHPSDTAFNQLIAECVWETAKDYCRMLRISMQANRDAR